MKNEIKVVGDNLHITRTFEAPVERVFDAWANADRRRQWSGCEGSECKSFTHEFRAGGRYRQILEIPNCGEIVMVGEYQSITSLEEIAYTMSCEPHEGLPPAPESLINVKFERHSERTVVVLVHSRLSGDEAKEAVAAGHRASLDRLAGVFASKQ